MRAFIESYGCTANHGRQQKIKEILRRRGYRIATLEDADLVVVNTCTVTGSTEQRMLHRIRELSSEKRVIATGCLPAAQPELLGDVEILRLDAYGPAASTDGVIGTINIADGCVGECSYCIVRRARGALQSYPLEDILDKAEELVRAGVREIRLTAQDLAAYGIDRAQRLPSLIEEIAGLEGDFMVRAGMMNPATTKEILPQLLDAFESPRVYKFLHIPVQSGSDDVLFHMRRGHTAKDFTDIVSAFRERFPDSTISTDFIVGYPTETEADFDLSMGLLKQIRTEKVNITRFSPRPGTPAAELPGLQGTVVKERSRRLTHIHLRLIKELMRTQVGYVVDAIIVEPGKDGSVVARDQAYRPIAVLHYCEIGERLRVRITDARHTYLIGEPLP